MTDKTDYDLGLDLVGDDTPAAPQRDEHGKFLPGARIPGAGRPKGMTQSEKIRALLEPEREKLIGEVLRMAYDQNPDISSAKVRALELALSRIAAPPKQESERVTVPGFAEATTLQAKAEAVITAAATGEISAEAAERLLRVLDVYSRAIVSTELERRIAAIEAGRAPITVNGSDGDA